MKEELEIENISSYFRRRGGRVAVFFKEAEEREGDIFELQRKVKELFPKAPGVQFDLGQRRGRHGGELGITLEVLGRDPETLVLVAEKIKGMIAGLPGLEDLTMDLETGTEEVRVKVRRDLATKYGLSPLSVARTVAAAYGSRPVTRMEIGGNEVEVVVQYQESDRRELARLDDMYVINASDEPVPLGAVSRFEVVEGPSTISRENRRRIIKITANTDRQGMYMLGGMIQQRMAGLELPPGYSWRLGEEYRAFRESERQSGFAIIIAVVMIYMLMAIVLLHHVNQLRSEGLDRREAIVTGGRDRLRPILMAALTTILGLVPLAFFQEEGRGAMWASMGKAVIGGLTASTFLTLILIPTFYSIFDDISRWFHELGRVVSVPKR